MYAHLSPAELIAEARSQVNTFDFESGSIVDPDLASALANALESTLAR